MIKLPTVNEDGCFEIRLESIGGLGANLCGKLLGELGANYLGLNAASFSSYGSEKRGSPVKSYIRWCDRDTPIRINSPVVSPHILGLFHENMIGKIPVTAGLTENCKLIAATDKNPAEVRALLRLYAGEIVAIDAQKIALESKSRVNMVMLGAIAKATDFIPWEPLAALIEETLGQKYPKLIEENLEGAKRGYTEGQSQVFSADRAYPFVPYREPQDAWGFETAPIGGINPHIGSTVSSDLSSSRTGYIPLFLEEKCIHCGLCDTTCPDMVFQFRMGELKGKIQPLNKGLDYHHCKGCLRCVEICPTGALVAGLEREHPNKKFFLPNQDLLPGSLEFETLGANSWITSESYLEEKSMNGGIM